MSQFDKARERAQSGAPGGDPTGIAVPEEAPANDVFDAPWSVREGVPPPALAAATLNGVGAPEPVQASAGLHLHPELAEKVVSDTDVTGLAMEQYRKVAGSLHQWQLEHGGKVVSVVSAVSGEGKTLTALNLALTLSSSYQRRVLLVDCDLRRPMLHEALQIPAEPGIAEIALSATVLEPVALSPRLSVVPAGRANDDPVAALTSSGLIALLNRAREDFDWVVLDTPPAAMLPDASLLSDHVDGSVLVVAAGQTDFEMVSRAVAAIGRERILGVVLNGVDARDMRLANYHDYYTQR